jgi:hypothetical protein
MQNIKIIHVAEGQTIWDIALQEYQNPEAVFIVYLANRDVLSSITHELEANMPLRILPYVDEIVMQTDDSLSLAYAAGFMHWMACGGTTAGKVQFRVKDNMLQWKYEHETTWNNLYALPSFEIEYATKSSSVHAGNLFDIAIDDDYFYVCVEAGASGQARWKRSPLIYVI